MTPHEQPPPRRPLPSDAQQERATFQQTNEKNGRILQPMIEAHLTGYAAALDELEWAHRRVADETALELDAATRQAGLWLITGRCIGLARAALHLGSAGYAADVAPVLRSLHEATRLLSAFALRGEERLVQRWLAGRNVSRGEVMAAAARQEEALAAEMLKEGVPPPGRTGDFFDRLYGRLSEFAHHRRRHLLDQVSVPARFMAAGPHPDWRARAVTVDQMGWLIVELVSVGGSALSQLWGPDWYHGRFQPTYRALLELKARIPLTDLATGKGTGQPGA